MRIATTVLALLTLAATTAAAGVVDRHFHETFAVEAGATLHLDHGDGDVEITVWDQNEIEVDVTFRLEVQRIGIGEDPDFSVDMEQRGNDVFVSEADTDSWTVGIFHMSRQHEYVYRIRVPREVNLDLDGEDGDIRIEDVVGRLDVVLDDGDLVLESVRLSRAVIETEDGDVRVRGGSGVFDIRVDDGDVRFEDVECVDLVVESEDGEIELGLLGEGAIQWRVDTEDGDVTLRAEGELDAEVDLATDDGRIRHDLEERGGDRRDAVRGRLGDGQGRLRIRTEDGDIDLLLHR
jgi:DUF4097 and DUF4098 domain-containing protein YvlB